VDRSYEERGHNQKNYSIGFGESTTQFNFTMSEEKAREQSVPPPKKKAAIRRIWEKTGLDIPTLTTMIVRRFEGDGLQLHRRRAVTVSYNVQDRLDSQDFTESTYFRRSSVIFET